MREVKFRGKRIDNGEWVYGGLIINIKNEFFIALNDSVYNIKNKCDVINSRVFKIFQKTVGQYTGLKDKNGVEIYEGDILDCGDRIIKVEWNNNFGLWDSIFLSYTDKELISNGVETVSYKYISTVIGNIH